MTKKGVTMLVGMASDNPIRGCIMLWVLPESIRTETGRFRIWPVIRNAFGDTNPNKAAVEMDKNASTDRRVNGRVWFGLLGAGKVGVVRWFDVMGIGKRGVDVLILCDCKVVCRGVYDVGPWELRGSKVGLARYVAAVVVGLGVTAGVGAGAVVGLGEGVSRSLVLVGQTPKKWRIKRNVLEQFSSLNSK
uniref:Uncharacterized protein n=1 Tax=Tanacetum cinerariifolium TaxID=118510 RepID=A0A6L2KWC4_TANCI|nr:hypothetical protein [Tanacetum cinerariifolium]